MSTVFPINPNAGGPDGDRPDPVMPDLDPASRRTPRTRRTGSAGRGTEVEGPEG